MFQDIPTYPADLAGKFQVRSTSAVDLVETFDDDNSGSCVLWFMPFHTISNFRSAVMNHLLHKNDGGDRQLAMDIVKFVQVNIFKNINRNKKCQNLLKKVQYPKLYFSGQIKSRMSSKISSPKKLLENR